MTNLIGKMMINHQIWGYLFRTTIWLASGIRQMRHIVRSCLVKGWDRWQFLQTSCAGEQQSSRMRTAELLRKRWTVSLSAISKNISSQSSQAILPTKGSSRRDRAKPRQPVLQAWWKAMRRWLRHGTNWQANRTPKPSGKHAWWASVATIW